MTIQINSLSFSSIFSSLVSFVRGQESEPLWTNFFNSVNGTLILRILSEFGAYISYIATVSRRETYLTYANNRSSLIGIAQNLGYPTVRGQNEVISLTVTPNFTGLIPAYTVVGSIKTLDLVTVQDVVVNTSVPTSLLLYVGNVKSEDYIITTNNPSVFRFSSENVSDFIRLKLNGALLPYSVYIKDLVSLPENKYVAMSNPLGSVDVFYLNRGSYKYKASDILTLEYIELASVQYNLADVNFNYGVVESIPTKIPYVSAETNEQIRTFAPLYAETKITVRGRSDYKKELLDTTFRFVDTNDYDYSPAVLGVTYIRDDNTLLSDSEKSNLLTEFNSRRAMGVPLPYLVDPTRIDLNLDIAVKKYTDALVTVENVETDVTNITNLYGHKLGITFDPAKLEHDIEQYYYVKTARISIPAGSWASGNKKLGEIVQSNGNYYIIGDLLGQSGNSEPGWTYTIDSIVDDNELVWQATTRVGTPHQWFPNKKYKIGDTIIPKIGMTWDISNWDMENWVGEYGVCIPDGDPRANYMFRCVSIIRRSSPVAPAFSTVVNAFTYDNEIIWKTLEKDSTQTDWAANTVYSKGDMVSYGSYNYQCVGFTADTGVTQPQFKTVDHYAITGIDHDFNAFVIAGNKTAYFEQGDVIQIHNSGANDGSYVVIYTMHTGGNTYVRVAQTIPSLLVSGDIYLDNMDTIDGNVLWKFLGSSISNIPFAWNEYLNIIPTVTVSNI